MDRLKKAALITRLIEKLREKESWCGETHVQKAAFFLQNLLEVPLELDFILYKHGPFSFDLRDELTSLRADELILLEPQQWPYGPRLVQTTQSQSIQELYSKTMEAYDDRIAFISEKLGPKGVSELERLATAFYITKRNENNLSLEERSRQIIQLKPHISPELAKEAVIEVDRIIDESQRMIEIKIPNEVTKKTLKASENGKGLHPG